jgi:hypothetical protein
MQRNHWDLHLRVSVKFREIAARHLARHLTDDISVIAAR